MSNAISKSKTGYIVNGKEVVTSYDKALTESERNALNNFIKTCETLKIQSSCVTASNQKNNANA